MDGYIDINTGTIEITFGSLIVSANLNTGDLLYPTGGHAIINDATSRSYSVGQREINHVISQTNEPDYTDKVEIYFDKLTGVAVSYSYDSTTTSNGYTVYYPRNPNLHKHRHMDGCSNTQLYDF